MMTARHFTFCTLFGRECLRRKIQNVAVMATKATLSWTQRCEQKHYKTLLSNKARGRVAKKEHTMKSQDQKSGFLVEGL